MKSPRLTLGTKITGTVLLVVLCFGAYVVLTNTKVGGVTQQITASTQAVRTSQDTGNRILEEVANANQFAGRVVEMLTTQLTLNQLNKLYLATEDAAVQMEHDELFEKLLARVQELAGDHAEIAGLAGPLAEYQEQFRLVDERILDQELDKARQISVTALDAAAKQIVETLRSVLDESSQHLQVQIQAARDAGQLSLHAVEQVSRAGSGMTDTIRTMSVVAGVLIVLCIVVAVAVPRVIVRNLLRVVEALRAIAHGDFTRSLTIQSNDEVGELGAELNRMSQELRQIIENVVTVSVELASAAEQLSATTTQIATGSEEMGSQAQNVASAAAEMTATVGTVAENVATVSEVSERAKTSTAEGGTIINEALGAFTRIQQVVGDAAQIVGALGKRSEQIGIVVEVIEDIADQTNLLALNAAIEAARAGDQGRGFAVVADEVRKLAEKTVKATQEISATVQAIQKDAVTAMQAMQKGERTVAEGSEQASRAGSAIGEIESGIRGTTEQVVQIAAATEELSVTIQDLARNMDEIAKGVDQNVAATSELSGTAATVAAQAEQLRAATARFTM